MSDTDDEDVLRELGRLRAHETARALFAAEKRADQWPSLSDRGVQPRLVRLDEFLAEPDLDAAYRVSDVWPVGGNVVLSAQAKAGKTTLVGNVLRSLVDGDPFLGAHEVSEPVGRVVLIDNELDPRSLRRWLRAHGIRNASRVEVLSLRGQVGLFDILDAETRSWWADLIGDCDVLILDCLRPVLDALGLDENRDAGRFLVPFDALKADVGASEALIVHHIGHGGERSRGDSRILDWPDATWKITRSGSDLTSARSFSAYGRDVDVPKQRLAFAADGKRFTLGEPSSHQSESSVDLEDARAGVLQFVTDRPGCGTREIRYGVPLRSAVVDEARKLLLSEGALELRTGAGRKHAHFIAGASYVSHVSDVLPGTRVPRVHVPLRGTGHGHGHDHALDVSQEAGSTDDLELDEDLRARVPVPGMSGSEEW